MAEAPNIDLKAELRLSMERRKMKPLKEPYQRLSGLYVRPEAGAGAAARPKKRPDFRTMKACQFCRTEFESRSRSSAPGTCMKCRQERSTKVKPRQGHCAGCGKPMSTTLPPGQDAWCRPCRRLRRHSRGKV